MNLNQVTIFSEKPVETVKFYRKLGLRLIVDSLPRYARLECPDGESTLSVNIADNIVTTNTIVLYFECDDLDEKVVELKKLGLEFDEDPTDRHSVAQYDRIVGGGVAHFVGTALRVELLCEELLLS